MPKTIKANTNGLPALMAYASTMGWAMDARVLDRFQSLLMKHEAGQGWSEDEVAGVARVEGAVEAIRSGPLAAGVLAAGAAGGSLEVSFADAGYTLYKVPGADKGVAVVPVGGVIAKYASQVNGRSQPKGTSTQALSKTLAAAASASDVASVLMVFDSPGGSVDGVAELADEIAAMAKDMPVESYADGLMASAALWLGVQAGKVTSSKLAEVGSIGVYAMLWDVSRAAENEGYQARLISSGGVKGGGAMGTRMSEDYVSYVQGQVDQYRDEFVQAVASGRGMSLEAAMKLADGRVHMGARAIEAGLVDAVEPLGSVIGRMAESAAGPRGLSGLKAGRHAGMQAGSVNEAKAQEAGVGTVADGLMPNAKTGKESPMGIKSLVLAAGAAMLLAPEGDGGNGGGTAIADPAVIGKIGDKFKADEAARRKAITEAAAKLGHIAGVADLAAKAKDDMAVTVEAFQSQLMEHLATATKAVGGHAAGAGGGGVGVSVGLSGWDKMRSAVETVMTVGVCPDAERVIEEGGKNAARVAGRLGFASCQDALNTLRVARENGLGAMRLKGLARQCAQNAGRPVGFDDETLFQAAVHSSSDFPQILKNVANKSMATQFVLRDTTYQQWVNRRGLNDFRPHTTVNLSLANGLQIVREGGEVKLATLNDRATEIKGENYGTGFKMTMQMFRNDDLGAFTALPQLFGRSARLLPDELVYALLESNSGNGPVMGYDSVALFDSAHDNIGTGAALSHTALEAAMIKIRGQKDFGPEKKKIIIRPRFLIVPPALEFKAKEILLSPYRTDAASVDRVANVLANSLQIIVADQLTSTTRWYIVADPSDSPAIEIGFLDNRADPVIFEKPQLSLTQMEFEIHMLGVGVAPVSHEAIFRT